MPSANRMCLISSSVWNPTSHIASDGMKEAGFGPSVSLMGSALTWGTHRRWLSPAPVRSGRRSTGIVMPENLFHL